MVPADHLPVVYARAPDSGGLEVLGKVLVNLRGEFENRAAPPNTPRRQQSCVLTKTSSSPVERCKDLTKKYH